MLAYVSQRCQLGFTRLVVPGAIASKTFKRMVHDMKEVFERLPKFAIPRNYKIELKPHLEKFVFDGQETIDLEIIEATKSLKLYCKDIKIKHASLHASGKEFSNVSVDYSTRWETATLTFSDEVPKGNASLMLKFEGELNDKMKGFYRSKYSDESGVAKYMATTQFESTFARQAFPCWDEPAYRATFDIALTVPSDKTALSNMNEISSTNNGDGWKTVSFARTPSMSTYLVAFIVGDFDYIEGSTDSGCLVRVYTLPGKKMQGEFALEVALKALPFYGKYFDCPYALPKCDLIAIPDFNFGAMENWGLVTYREVCLLLDPAQSSTTGKENIALVVGHELAHMWFGNLCTMEWWTDLWLKEGYATFMEYVFVNAHYPDFDIWTRFIKDETLGSLGLDSLQSSHPIEVPINDPEEVEEIYDSISYDKSSSIIRMLYAYLGEETFQQALRGYLKKHAYKNTITEDLWRALSEVCGQDIASLMRNWTQKMGYPVVKVHGTQDGSNCNLHLVQQRFLSDGSTDEAGTLWQVPITISTSRSPNEIVHRVLLKEHKQDVVIPNVNAGEWIKLNSGFTGYYRVQYSDEMLNLLAPAIKAKVLSPVDRFNIVGDLFALVRAGQASTVQFLNVVENLTQENDYTVWSDIDGSIGIIANCLSRTDMKAQFDAFIIKLYSHIAGELGWDPKPNESHTTGLLRPLILGRLGRCGHAPTLTEACRRFKEHISGGKQLQPDLRAKVFGLAVMAEGGPAYDALVKLFETSDFSEVQRHCLMAFAQTNNVSLQHTAIEYGISSGKVRLQDLFLIFYGLVTTHQGQETAWEYFKQHIEDLVTKHGSSTSLLFGHILKTCARMHCSEEKATEIEQFFAKSAYSNSAALKRPIGQSVENVRLNAGLLKRDADSIRQWLVKRAF